MRTKQDYVLSERNGKQVPEKVGLKPIQRDEISYEFTLVFDLDLKHLTRASKDRTGIFMDKKEDFLITQETGRQIRKWTQEGSASRLEQILACDTIEDLKALYDLMKPVKGEILDAFTQQKEHLTSPNLNP